MWKRISDAPTPPNATDEDYTTREVLLAAVLQGALFGLIKSAVDRAGMRAVKRVVNGPAPPADPHPDGRRRRECSSESSS